MQRKKCVCEFVFEFLSETEQFYGENKKVLFINILVAPSGQQLPVWESIRT